MTALLPTLEFADAIDPEAPFREFHKRTVGRPIDVVWPHCLGVTAKEIRTMGPLFAVRGLPARLRGKTPPEASAPKPLLQVFAHEGFVLLRQDDEPTNGRAVAIFGAVGKFWSMTANAPVPLATAQEFVDFDTPGFAKTVCRLEAFDQGDGTTRIETETLVVGTDPTITKKFRPYWLFIRLFSGLIRRSWLAAIDRRASNA